MQKILNINVSVYFNVQHDTIKQFVNDLEKYGIKRESLKDDFGVIILRKTGEIVEIVKYDAETNDLVTNRVFNENDEYTGHSYVLDKN